MYCEFATDHPQQRSSVKMKRLLVKTLSILLFSCQLRSSLAKGASLPIKIDAYDVGPKNHGNESTEIYACYPDEGYNDETYAELKLFSEYFTVSQITEWKSDYTHVYPDPSKRAKFTNEEPASRVRPCNRELVNCKDFVQENVPTYFCFNKKNALKRYSSVSLEHEKLLCDQGAIEAFSLHGQFKDFRALLQCTCLERRYYFSIKPVSSNVSRNKVITGARLVLIGSALHIQIEEGVLGAGGIIEANSTQWKPIEKTSNNNGWGVEVRSKENGFAQISWNKNMQISLSKSQSSNDAVLTGLQFVAANDERVELRMTARKFDFDTGILHSENEKVNASCYREVEFELKDPDVSTKTKLNTIHSKDGQFVRFQTTSLEKDGGQSVVPFIDTQYVGPVVPTPLKGAQLFVKTQEGFGGFLGLKLFTL